MQTVARPTPLVFRATLSAKVFREIEVAANCSLHNLAKALVGSFDFDFDHAFGFYSRLTGNPSKSAMKYELFADIGEGDGLSRGVKRTQAVKAFSEIGDKMLLLFDYGDNWQFIVERLAAELSDKPQTRPRLLRSVGLAPEQYPLEDEDYD